MRLTVLAAALVLAGCANQAPTVDTAPESTGRTWLAGDHHIHSHYSVTWKANEADPSQPPVAVVTGDARYPIPVNAQMAREFGLSWMVSTDHGGPQHSKVNFEQAYPELLQSREDVPEVIQFYGMEFDTPGADHSSLIIPKTDGEREALREIEQRFSKREPWPADKSWDAEPRMVEALRFMKATATPPVLIANHPSRSATEMGGYGDDRPAELRDWNDAAPNVAIGMEGAPGHQAGTLNADGSIDPKGSRGGYSRAPTMGGFDQMTARLGGFWDSMLGDGRRWWITSTSDSHVHYTDGGSDFWPGQYSKTYVLARKEHDDILNGLRNGRIFVTTGDLISGLDVLAASGGREANIGGELSVTAGQDVAVTIRVRDPAAANRMGHASEVARVDLIVGDVAGPAASRDTDANPTTKVLKRYTATDWKRDGEMLTMRFVIPDVRQSFYVRVRGTNTSELEPLPDPRGENPWDDLWFYSNPVFVKVG
jgi:hypothetical protein